MSCFASSQDSTFHTGLCSPWIKMGSLPPEQLEWVINLLSLSVLIILFFVSALWMFVSPRKEYKEGSAGAEWAIISCRDIKKTNQETEYWEKHWENIEENVFMLRTVWSLGHVKSTTETGLNCSAELALCSLISKPALIKKRTKQISDFFWWIRTVHTWIVSLSQVYLAFSKWEPDQIYKFHFHVKCKDKEGVGQRASYSLCGQQEWDLGESAAPVPESDEPFKELLFAAFISLPVFRMPETGSLSSKPFTEMTLTL